MVVLIIETQFKNDTEALIHRPYNKLVTRRIIAKRGIKCNLDEYNLGVQCCKKCESGEYHFKTVLKSHEEWKPQHAQLLSTGIAKQYADFLDTMLHCSCIFLLQYIRHLKSIS